MLLKETAAPCGAAEFREETSKDSTIAVRGESGARKPDAQCFSAAMRLTLS